MTAWLDNLSWRLPLHLPGGVPDGQLARFDRDQYTWKSDSSQLLRTGSLRWGSNLFHIGVLFLFFGHFVGMLTPHWCTSISSARQQAVDGHGLRRYRRLLCFVGLSLLLHRRLFDPRIRATSHRPATSFCCDPVGAAGAGPGSPFRCLAQHLDGAMMEAGRLEPAHRDLPQRWRGAAG
jgi:nitrate reductase gamma subunit